MNRRITFVFLVIFIFVCSLFYFNNTEIDTIKIQPNNTKDIHLSSRNAKVSEKFGTFFVSAKSDIFTRQKLIKIDANNDTKLKIELAPPVYKRDFENHNAKPHKVYAPRIIYKDFNINVNGDISKIFDKSELQNSSFSCDLELKKGDAAEIFYSQQLQTGNAAFIFLLFIFLGISIFLKEKNLTEYLAEKINAIPILYRKTFLISVLSMTAVFLFYITTVTIGDHNWNFLVQGFPINNDLFDGRYGAHTIKNILFQGQYIPLISDLVSFAVLSLAAIMILVYWKIPKKFSYFLILTLLYVLQPFVIEWLYFKVSLPDIFCAPLLIVCGLILSEKCKTLFCQKRYLQFAGCTIAAIFLLNFSVSIYPSTINAVAIIFLGRIFIDLLSWNGSKMQIKSVFLNHIPTAINIFIAMILYKIILILMELSGILVRIYAIEQIRLEDLPQRVTECIYAAFLQLGSYSFPFMPNSICLIFTSLLIILVINLICNKKDNLSSKQHAQIVAVQLLMLIFALFSTKLATLICQEPQLLETRIDFFGLHIFRILIVCALFITAQNKRDILNFTVLCAIAIISISAVNDLKQQKLLHLSYNAEKMFLNRVYERIESDKNFDANKKYFLIQIGEIKAFGQNFYRDNYLKQYDALPFITHSIDPSWIPFSMLEVTVGNYFIKERYNFKFALDSDEFKKLLLSADKKGLLKIAKPWPDKNSIIIDNDLIIFVTEEKSLEEAKDFVKNEM